MSSPATQPGKQTVLAALSRVERVLRRRPVPAADDLRALRNFLVLQYDLPLGSVVHATPLYAALRAAVPQARITVAASGMAAGVLSHHPAIDRCVVTPHPAQNFFAACRSVRALLHSMPPDTCGILTTVGNSRPRVALLAFAAGNSVRIGHTIVPQLYDVPLSFHPERGQIESNLDIVRALGHSAAPTEPQIFFTRTQAEQAAQLLSAATDPQAPRIAFVTQNSRGQRNQWSADRFLAVITALTGAAATPVFVGTAADAPAIDALRHSLANPGISLAGKTTIPLLAAVLAQCDLVISLDTGTFHVARAVGLPGVVLAPAWQTPLEWLPVAHPRYRVLRGPSIPFPPPDDYWLQEISVRDVVTAAEELLHKFPPSASARAQRRQQAQAPESPR